MRFFPVSLDALLVELANLDETLALFDALQQSPIAGVQEIVPAARTLLVHFRPSTVSREALAAQIATCNVSGKKREAGKLVEIPVHYNGEDLAAVAQELGISTDEVIRRHTGRLQRCILWLCSWVCLSQRRRRVCCAAAQHSTHAYPGGGSRPSRWI